jgi:hypothetical protein
MAQIEQPKPTWRVDIIESERGWGQRVDESIYFDNEAEAKKYSFDYNAKYNPPLKPGESVPDWYMVASSPVRIV